MRRFDLVDLSAITASTTRSRREFLRLGGGLAIAGWQSAQPWRRLAASETPTAKSSSAHARSCVLVYLLGGPSHLDMFDLKPAAPSEIRGPFQPIATSMPGLQICEHLPRLAAMAHKLALVRSVSHPNSNHTPMIYYTLTGRHTAAKEQDNDVRPPQRSDFPHVGSVLAKFCSGLPSLPGYVAIPEVAIRSSIRGEFKRARTALRGGGSGFLGPRYEPLAVNGEPGTATAIPALTLPADVSAERFAARSALLEALDRRLSPTAEIHSHAELRNAAVLLTGSNSRGTMPAFSLEGEPVAMRDKYGRHRFGQSLLLARRLAESGVPMIAVHFNEMTVCDGWDTHANNFPALQDELLPMLDQGLSALIDDLDQRGRLDETLIVCMGEFGRTPKINSNGGRDHWGDCGAALLAGGGVRGGQVLGASDRHGAFPISRKVDPTDIQATIYHAMGLDPKTHIYDQQQRPWEISTGIALSELF